MRLLILLMLLMGHVSAQRLSFNLDESFTFATGFRLLTVGQSVMTIVDDGEYARAGQIHVLTIITTKPFYNSLYRINDRIDLWLAEPNMEVRQIRRSINEGNYHLEDSSLVVPDSNLIHYRKGTLTTVGPVFDPMGAIYHFRSLPLNVGDVVKITIFDGKRLRPIAIKVRGLVTVQVEAGTYECLELVPSPLDDQPMTKVNGILSLWLSNDDRRLPVKIEQMTNFGTMVLKLSDYDLADSAD
ncbi:DUF3108 domain-containing protein [Candidatus Neomarinimicrobiota bacterium]